uniref:Uncharacterized protein n=1 Tax=Anguilla anguilla TaxID=7936 RepID=A0A0E9PX75_ANGAN
MYPYLKQTEMLFKSKISKLQCI